MYVSTYILCIIYDILVNIVVIVVNINIYFV